MIKSTLPQEKVTSRRKIKLIKILIIVLFIFLTVNFLAYFYLKNYTSNEGYFIVSKKWELVTKTKKKIKWLIVGDSSGNQGVSTDIFENSFGGEAYNVCTLGDNTCLIDSWMLDYWIRENGAPENILMVHVYDVWPRSGNSYMFSQNPLMLAFSMNLRPDVFSFSKKLNLLYKKYFALYYQNSSLSRIIQNPRNLFQEHYKMEEHGFIPHPNPNKKRVHEDIKGHLWNLRNNTGKFAISNINKKSLQAIKQMVEDNKIKLFIANSPIAEDLYKSTEYQNYFKGIKSYLADYCNQSQYIHYINNPQMTFADSLMINADHLIERAAFDYSLKLANEIKIINKYSN